MREDFFDDQLEPISPTDSERVRQLVNAFSVLVLFQSRSQGRRSAPTAGLKLANAFGVNQQG
jgi:hypothetical protein